MEGETQHFFKSQSLYKPIIEAELEIFPNPRAQEEARAWNFSKSQGSYKEGEFVIFPRPKDYIKTVLAIFPSPKAHIDMGVPNPIIY